MPQKRAVCFVDDEWEIFLHPDSSLTVCRAGEPILGDYENVFDFLGEHHRLLRSCPVGHPINQLANFLNYPVCLLDQWISDRKKHS